MYIKKIKRGRKIYSYYYHNIKEESRVKNIFLESSKKETLAKLSKFFQDLSIINGADIITNFNKLINKRDLSQFEMDEIFF